MNASSSISPEHRPAIKELGEVMLKIHQALASADPSARKTLGTLRARKFELKARLGFSVYASDAELADLVNRDAHEEQNEREALERQKAKQAREPHDQPQASG